MNVLIFGAAGFIGRRLVASLMRDGVTVVGADVAAAPAGAGEEFCSFHFADVGDRDAVTRLVAEIRPDVIVNLAYLTGAALDGDMDRATRVNLNGHVHLLDAAVASGARRYVYSSSIAAYGPSQALYGERAIEESDSCPLERHTITYGAMKAFNDFVAAQYRARGAIETCGVRFSIVFGPGRFHGYTAWTSQMLVGPARGEFIRIPLAAEQPLSLLSAEDASRLLALAVRSRSTLPPLLNSGGSRHTARRIAEEVERIEPKARFAFDDTSAPFPFVDHVSAALADRTLGFRVQPLPIALGMEMKRAATALDSPC